MVHRGTEKGTEQRVVVQWDRGLGVAVQMGKGLGGRRGWDIVQSGRTLLVEADTYVEGVPDSNIGVWIAWGRLYLVLLLVR